MPCRACAGAPRRLASWLGLPRTAFGASGGKGRGQPRQPGTIFSCFQSQSLIAGGRSSRRVSRAGLVGGVAPTLANRRFWYGGRNFACFGRFGRPRASGGHTHLSLGARCAAPHCLPPNRSPDLQPEHPARRLLSWKTTFCLRGQARLGPYQ